LMRHFIQVVMPFTTQKRSFYTFEMGLLH